MIRTQTKVMEVERERWEQIRELSMREWKGCDDRLDVRGRRFKTASNFGSWVTKDASCQVRVARVDLGKNIFCSFYVILKMPLSPCKIKNIK